jgi:hypothetical protein
MSAAAQPALTRRDLEARLVEKCWKDPDFQRDVVADPKATFERHFGQKLPENVAIHIHEEDANTLHFSIPPAPTNMSELSEEELERVAGGTDATVILLTLGILMGGVIAGAAYTGASVAKGSSKPW